MIIFIIIFIASIILALIASVKFFYRDPERSIAQTDDAVLSPADGTVVSVRRYLDGEASFIGKGGKSFRVDELLGSAILGSKGLIVSIHISPLDVHTIRAPAEGKIIYIAKIGGSLKFMRDPSFEVENERVGIVLETSLGRLGVVVIGAPIASSVKTLVGLGDNVSAGQRIARIRLGSLASLITPSENSLSPVVKCGDRVLAGQSIIARRTDTSSNRKVEECYKTIRSTTKERIYLIPLAVFVLLKKIYTYLFSTEG